MSEFKLRVFEKGGKIRIEYVNAKSLTHANKIIKLRCKDGERIVCVEEVGY